MDVELPDVTVLMVIRPTVRLRKFGKQTGIYTRARVIRTAAGKRSRVLALGPALVGEGGTGPYRSPQWPQITASTTERSASSITGSHAHREGVRRDGRSADSAAFLPDQ